MQANRRTVRGAAVAAGRKRAVVTHAQQVDQGVYVGLRGEVEPGADVSLRTSDLLSRVRGGLQPERAVSYLDEAVMA